MVDQEQMQSSLSTISVFYERWKNWSAELAFESSVERCTYGWLLERLSSWGDELGRHQIVAGTSVALHCDYSPESCALFLALIERACIVVPLTGDAARRPAAYHEMAKVEFVFDLQPGRALEVTRIAERSSQELLEKLRQEGAPGLVVFSSGSTGQPKGIVHDMRRVLLKFQSPRKPLKTLVFLHLDHFGGVNTLLSILSSGGTVCTVSDRLPQTICRAVHERRVELLPVTPSFLNLLLLSQEYEKWDLSSLVLITYGTEMMPALTLEKMRAILPAVSFQQTYGLSEVGVLRTKSKDSSSLWVKVGGEGFETKVVDHVLWIRSASSMLGYLNASQPFDEDGWFNTGDVVEEDGEYLLFKGRQSEIINVGGEKVFPAEVESVILELSNVADVVIVRQANPILGAVVLARVNLITPESHESVRSRLVAHCRERLARYKIPAKVEIVEEPLFSNRHKRIRTAHSA